MLKEESTRVASSPDQLRIMTILLAVLGCVVKALRSPWAVHDRHDHPAGMTMARATLGRVSVRA